MQLHVILILLFIERFHILQVIGIKSKQYNVFRLRSSALSDHDFICRQLNVNHTIEYSLFKNDSKKIKLISLQFWKEAIFVIHIFQNLLPFPQQLY